MLDLNHLHLHVDDLAPSRRFYETYFGFVEHVWHGEILFLRNAAGFDLALVPDPAPREFPAWFHFGARLASGEAVRELHARMQAGGATIHAPLSEYDDFVFFRCKDPDGYQIEVYWE